MINITLIGRAGKNPEIKFFDNGSVVAKTSMAVNTDKENTMWFQVEAWGKTAEIMGDYITKGKQFGVNGRLKENKWQDQQGNARSSLVVTINQLQLLGSKDDNPPSNDDIDF